MAINPDIQNARVNVTQARENMDTRLKSSTRLVVAFENYDLNQAYLDANTPAIKQLVERTASLGKAITTLEGAGVDPGTTKISVPGKLWGERKIERSIVDVQEEIQSNLDKDVVKTGLMTLGIIEQPKVKAPLFTLPERPSNRTLAKAAVGTVVAGTVAGLGYKYSDKIAGMTQYVGIPSAISSRMPSLDSITSRMPSLDSITSRMPSLDSIRNVFTMDNVGYAGSSIKSFFSNTNVQIGLAGTGLVVASVLAYKAIQNRKAAQQ